MILSKSTKYAIRALICISYENARDFKPGVEAISKEIDAPQAYTAKVLQRLTKSNLLGSAKGRGGGFFLENPDLTPYEVIVELEGKAYFDSCGFGVKNCSDSSPCLLHEEYKPIKEKYLMLVQNRTIKMLAEDVTNDDALKL
ncbi:MAG: RrF2 family transcriptional regulator [Bacteroidales bacterium]